MAWTKTIAGAGVAGLAMLAAAQFGGASAQDDVQAMVEAADAAAGQTVSFQCIGCHTFGEGEGTRVGPELYGIVGRTIGGVEGFPYSEAMAELGAAGEVWTVEMLDAFLTNPQETVPGTTMAFGGVPDDARYNLIAYMMSLGGM